MKKSIIVCLFTIALTSLTAFGQTPKVDPRLKTALTKTGLNAAATKLGNYMVEFKYPDGRGQLAFVSSETGKKKNTAIETRKIWAYIVFSKKTPSQDLLARLLKANVVDLIGKYELHHNPKDTDAPYKVVYSALVPADCHPTFLKDTIRIVAGTADYTEKEITKKDIH